MLGEKIINLPDTCQIFNKVSPANQQIPESLFFDMLAFLQQSEASLKSAYSVLEWVESTGVEGLPAEFVHALSEVQLAPLIDQPSKVICIGLNYADHCREQNLDLPTSMILFAKFPSAINGPEGKIFWPKEVSQQVDYEAELAVVIGKTARNVSEQDAYEYIAGYTIANDVSARDVQFADQQWVRGKSFDTFCPIGPCLVTRDEIPQPHQLGIRCWVNGEIRQDSNTDQMIFTIPEAIAFITRTCTLLPGDIICTGTPNGVGVFRDPPVFLKSGDVIEIEIEKLGRLRNFVS